MAGLHGQGRLLLVEHVAASHLDYSLELGQDSVSSDLGLFGVHEVVSLYRRVDNIDCLIL